MSFLQRFALTVFLFTGFGGGILLSNAHFLKAQTVDELQNSIVQSTSQIDDLKKQIAQLQLQLTATGKDKQTLQNAIHALDLNIQKLQKSITLTTAQIKQKDSEIGKLSNSISTTTSEIGTVQSEVANALGQLDQVDQEPLAFVLLSGGTLSSLFDQATTLAAVRTGLQSKVQDLSKLKQNLESSKTTALTKKQELAAMQQDLGLQQKSLTVGKQTQTQLLVETKNKESVYQSQLAQKKAQEAKFEQDLQNFESQLNLKVSVANLPKSGTGSLSWPLDHPRITQYFGNTPFATANPQVYNGHGHNAIDLAASPGTPLKAAREGVVLGTGNTDVTCPGASYGKWVFIKHDNGLSTIYAHLSSIGVSKGDSVKTGQVIGFSGSTGYATGPHLHFGVYASDGSEIASFASKSCIGKTYTMPVADLSAYLNPLSYLPAL